MSTQTRVETANGDGQLPRPAAENESNGSSSSPSKNHDPTAERPFELPKPRLAPDEVEKPEDVESLQDRMASDEEIDANKVQREAYEAWETYVTFKEEVESINNKGFAKDGEENQHILADGGFRNGHEVNELLLTQLRTVMVTDADRTKRDAAYKYLDNVVTRHKGLRLTWDYNKKRMAEWGTSGYEGEFEFCYLDQSGEVIKNKKGEAAHTPPGKEEKYWIENDFRKEADLEQNKLQRLPPSPALDEIRARVEDTLKKTAQQPDLIRTQSGVDFGIFNATISTLSDDYIKKFNSSKGPDDDDRLASLVDQRIQDIRIFHMIVEFVEQMISTGETDFEEFLKQTPNAKAPYDLLDIKMRQAGHPNDWFELIRTTVVQKVDVVKQFKLEHPEVDYHEHAEIWKSDLKDWLIKKTDAGQFYSSPVKLDSEGPTPDPQAVNPEGPAPPQEPSSAGGSDAGSNNAASTEQESTSQATSAPPAVSTDAYTVRYLGTARTIAGYRFLGLYKSANAFECLIRMNGEEEAHGYYHIVARSTFEPRGRAETYLEGGGYLVKDQKDTKKMKRSLRLGRSVEGEKDDIEDGDVDKFSIRAIAVKPRNRGTTYKRPGNTMELVQGYFTDKGLGTAKWYPISTLGDVWGNGWAKEMMIKIKQDMGVPLVDLEGDSRPEQTEYQESSHRTTFGNNEASGRSHAVRTDLGTDGRSETRDPQNSTGRNQNDNHRVSADDGWTLPVNQESTASLKALEERMMSEVNRRMEIQSKELRDDFSQKLAAGFESQRADMASQKNDMAKLTAMMENMMSRNANVV